MTVLQCGFIASGAGEPDCSKDISSARPVPVSSDVQLTSIYPGGWGFGLAISADGKLYSWGINSATLLGKSGSADDGADPSTLELVVEGAATAAAGFDHGLVVQQGKLFAFGPAHRESTEALLRPIAFDAPVSAVAAGEHHTLILTTAGNVYTFGSNREGQLGTSVGDDSANPVLGLGPGTGSCYSSLAAPVVAIAAGARHSVAVNSQGQCLAWGWSLHGQCGTGEIVPSVPTPTVVSSLGPLKCKAAAAGSAHTLCLTDGGDVYTWGSNADGALGLGDADSSLVPQLVEGIEDEDGNVVKVTAGARHSVAVCSSGKAFSWGYGAFGQLGTGSYESASVPQSVAVPGVKDAVAGWWHTLFLME